MILIEGHKCPAISQSQTVGYRMLCCCDGSLTCLELREAAAGQIATDA